MHDERAERARDGERIDAVVMVEAAILVSRLDRLPRERITRELAYLQNAIDKTAGDDEREAWGWLMARVTAHFER